MAFLTGKDASVADAGSQLGASITGYTGSHNAIFSHPQIGSLTVQTGMDDVSWSYELNTVNFPTYAGEVVQILSVFIGDLSINGSVGSYQDVENIYSYFARYFQIASQGNSTDSVAGQGAYNQQPMTFLYSHREWSFQIMPLSAPAFRISRDIVVPEWHVQAHVIDDTGDIQDLKDLIVDKILSEDSDNGTFDLKGEIGFKDKNPFSDPNAADASGSHKFDKDSFHQGNEQLAKYYNDLIPSYLDGDFDSLTDGIGSKPAFGVTSPSPTPNSDAGLKKKLAPSTTSVKSANKSAKKP